MYFKEFPLNTTEEISLLAQGFHKDASHLASSGERI